MLHLQWLALPQADVRLRFRSPSVFTAHDLLPRRTASRTDLWRRLLARFDRIVVHTERGRETLAELGVEARVIPHPVYPSAATRADNGATLLALGVIRPYKGLADAIEVTRRLPDARLLVAGDPAMPLGELRAAARVEWRLGYLPPAELDRALSEATVAVFPYRAELDQSGSAPAGARCRCAAVVYDVAGLGEPIRAFGAGRSRAAGRRRRSDGSRERAALRPRGTLGCPRAGAERPRRADVGRVGRAASRSVPRARLMFRRARYSQVIDSQLELFEARPPRGD